MAARPAAGSAGQAPSRRGEFTEGTVYRTRARSWKRPVLAAVVVFGVTMAGITTYELASGHNLSGGRSTTVGDAFSRGGTSAPDSGGADTSGTNETSDSGPSGSGTPTAPVPPTLRRRRRSDGRPVRHRRTAGRQPLALHRRGRPYDAEPEPDPERHRERGRREHHPRCALYAPRTLRK
ncbi:hypothetical protein AB0929_35405 [Streptomyces massasporeus]|uniref:hypothetical protein n=1 Tax=Streptomyces massasporeus TaxID=67324 RepID=UPI0034513AA4